MGGIGSGKRRNEAPHEEIEAARTELGRALAKANREGTPIRCAAADVRMVLFGIVAVQAENAALRRDLARVMKAENEHLNELESLKSRMRKEPAFIRRLGEDPA